MPRPGLQSVYIIFNDVFFLIGLSKCLRDAGCAVAKASRDLKEVVVAINAVDSILIVDPSVNEDTSFEICRLAKRKCRSIRVLIFRDDNTSFGSLIDAYHVGIDAYLPIDINCDEMIRSIEALARGYQLLPIDSLSLAASDFHLTKREKSIVRLLAMSKQTKEIASALGIRESTVRNHIQAIMEKMGEHDRVGVIRRSRRRGVVRRPTDIALAD